ncbi:universal stress protein [Peribacillus kribbensis]|uniref:universal stress protein n=1 Tax=Peribacillus kribbensis TaxID=356658 RepID=UPI0003FCD372|nr:universal stress protein [Peribacillus kribbensis]
MSKKVLAAIDGGSQTAKVLDTVISFIEEFEHTPELTVLYVNRSIPFVDPAGFTEVDVETALDKEGSQVLSDARNHLNSKGADCHVKAVSGDPAEMILTEAKIHDYIVVGSRGLGVISEAVLGSVSHKIIQQAECPVIIAK